MDDRTRVLMCLSLCLTIAALSRGGEREEWKERRGRAAEGFADGLLLVHSKALTDFVSDGYRERAAFYYLTGLENSPGAILAIDSASRESWLFLPPAGRGEVREVEAGDAAAQRLGLEHVVEWTEFEKFLSKRIAGGKKIYYEAGVAELPGEFSTIKDGRAPAWIQVLANKWPGANFQAAGRRLYSLMAVESASEQQASREAARATVSAVLAGMRAIRPGVSQRSVEVVVENSCWTAGARGVSFWPWIMAGANGMLPKPFESAERYDHLDGVMKSGDLVRVDVGCEWKHYQGDLGRTVPVSRHYTDEQRETWNLFVAAYRATAKTFREGVSEDQAFETWKQELLRHRETTKTALAKQAIETWSDRKNMPYWQMHTMNLDAGYIEGTLKPGMVIDFEPIASLGGQGYYLEDMYLIGKESAEVLTPGVPYTAEEIEAYMTKKR
ncbi:MAG TPA: aminopeptidase P N-terminal domain-containing protein [Candidatus Acidoferrum sp.]|nr:aminopeptidase P N-terminal domain-containing protein [Candidatus Acidoferrum sp.]